MSRFWRIIDAFFLGMLSFLQASHPTCTHRPAVFTAHFEGENGPISEMHPHVANSVLRANKVFLPRFAYGPGNFTHTSTSFSHHPALYFLFLFTGPNWVWTRATVDNSMHKLTAVAN